MPRKCPKSFIGLSEEVSDSDPSPSPHSEPVPRLSRLKRRRRSEQGDGDTSCSPSNPEAAEHHEEIASSTYRIPSRSDRLDDLESAAKNGSIQGDPGEDADDMETSLPILDCRSKIEELEGAHPSNQDLEAGQRGLGGVNETSADCSGGQSTDSPVVHVGGNAGAFGTEFEINAPSEQERDSHHEREGDDASRGDEVANGPRNSSDGRTGQASEERIDCENEKSGRNAQEDFHENESAAEVDEIQHVPDSRRRVNREDKEEDFSEIQPASPTPAPNARKRGRKKPDPVSDSEWSDWEGSSDEEEEEDVSEYELEDVKPKRSKKVTPKAAAKAKSNSKAKAAPKPKAAPRVVQKAKSERIPEPPKKPSRTKSKGIVNVPAQSAASASRKTVSPSPSTPKPSHHSSNATGATPQTSVPRKTLGARRPMTSVTNVKRENRVARPTSSGSAPLKKLRVGLSKRARVPRLHAYLADNED